MTDDRVAYRALIDSLVASCLGGQGQIAAKRARAGVWNANADHVPGLEDQWAYNGLLRRLPAEDRELLAQLLEQAFEGGVHETLVNLHEQEVPPFDNAYEGTPYHDFIGRLAGWEWPTEPPQQRS